MKKFYFPIVTRFFDISRSLETARKWVREARFLNSVTGGYSDSVAHLSGSVQEWRARRRKVFANLSA